MNRRNYYIVDIFILTLLESWQYFKKIKFSDNFRTWYALHINHNGINPLPSQKKEKKYMHVTHNAVEYFYLSFEGIMNHSMSWEFWSGCARSNPIQLYKISIRLGLIFFSEEIGKAQEVFTANQEKNLIK